MSKIVFDKSKMKDDGGRLLTQGLFLEIDYNTKYAMFTLDDDDKEYKGKTYYSLKRLYLLAADPTEYEFAKEYLLGWKHWLRIKANKVLSLHIQEWEEELELATRSAAVLNIIDMANSDSGFQAAKFLANKGWDTRRAGRPSKDEKQKYQSMEDRLNEEFSEDYKRLN